MVKMRTREQTCLSDGTAVKEEGARKAQVEERFSFLLFWFVIFPC